MSEETTPAAGETTASKPPETTGASKSGKAPAKAPAKKAPKAKAAEEAPRVVQVELRRPHKYGEQMLPGGETIAQIKLPPGMSWQFVVSAIQNDLARVNEDQEDEGDE